MINDDYIKEHLSYNSTTGIVTWKKRAAMCVKIGSEAGHCDHYHGYRRIRICHQNMSTHRIAWFLYYGKWPDEEIDHINGIRDDNRIDNLREVTHRINQQNRIEHRNGRYLGVDFIKGKWKARIVIKNKVYSLGFFASEKEAAQAYHDACITLENNPSWVPPKQENTALGCSYKPKIRKWQAKINICGKDTYLGVFNTKEEAHNAYINAYNQKTAEQRVRVPTSRCRRYDGSAYI